MSKIQYIKSKIKAFSLFEVTVALAILSILLTIITVSLNRFNEQIKLSSDVRQELNDFYVVRSNLWRELYESDSLICVNNELKILSGDIETLYFIEDERLFRKKDDQVMDLKIPIESISEVEEGKKIRIVFSFIWKGEIMKLSYLKRANLDKQINQYFEELK
jgi:prepilin-type N-terminal cleavage/methylation domain-containing protein